MIFTGINWSSTAMVVSSLQATTIVGAPEFTGTPDFSAGATMTAGQFLTHDGSAAAPAIAPASAPTTGLSFPGSLLTLGASGTSRMSVSGNITAAMPIVAASYIEFLEIAAPTAPVANRVRVFAIDDTAKTEVGALFNTGTRQEVAQEP